MGIRKGGTMVRKLLHLGSGRKRIPGYINVDANKNNQPDIVAVVDNLLDIRDDTVDGIYACHVLEHTHRGAVQGVLEEWHRVLRPGGELRVAVPDFEEMVYLYTEEKVSLERLWGLFYGGNRTQWDDHQVVFDYETLCVYLTKAGFHSMHRYDPNVWVAECFSKIGYIDFSMAVINQRLISLNVLAMAK